MIFPISCCDATSDCLISSDFVHDATSDHLMIFPILRHNTTSDCHDATSDHLMIFLISYRDATSNCLISSDFVHDVTSDHLMIFPISRYNATFNCHDATSDCLI